MSPRLGLGTIAFVALVLLGADRASAQDAPDEGARREGGFDLAGFERAIEEVADAVRPTVVSIRLARRVGVDGEREGELRAVPLTVELSGVVISRESDVGTIVTLGRELLRADAATIRFPDGHEVAGRITGVDPDTTIGLITVDAAAAGDRLVAATLGDDRRLRPGSIVVAVGNPFGLRGSVSFGCVAGVGRTVHQGRTVFDDAIQITTAVNPGDPGGFLANVRGELVGLLSTSYQPEPPERLRDLLAPRMARAEGIHFAVPVRIVSDVVSRLRRDGKVRRGWLGADVLTIDRAVREKHGLEGGVMLIRVAEKGPAAAAKLERSDIIVTWGGAAVDGIDALRRQVWGASPGTEVELGVIRSGERIAVRITVGERPAPGAGDEKKEGERVPR